MNKKSDHIKAYQADQLKSKLKGLGETEKGCEVGPEKLPLIVPK